MADTPNYVGVIYKGRYRKLALPSDEEEDAIIAWLGYDRTDMSVQLEMYMDWPLLVFKDLESYQTLYLWNLVTQKPTRKSIVQDQIPQDLLEVLQSRQRDLDD